MNKQALQTKIVTVAGADTYEDLGPAIPQNMRRYVYQIKVISPNIGTNKVTIADRLGVAAETEKDAWYLVTAYSTVMHPDVLAENAAPVYIFEASSSTADRMIRIKSDTLGAIVTIWYCDEP